MHKGMDDLIVKALAWTQMAGVQLLALPRTAHMTLNRPRLSSPDIFRDARPVGITWR